MILFLLLIAHFLADFTFQPKVLAKKKAESFKFLLLHSAIYAAVISAAGFTVTEPEAMLLPFAVIALSHFMLDWLRVLTDGKFKNAAVHFWSFVIDQALHVLILAGVYFLFGLGEHKLAWFENALRWTFVVELIVTGLIFAIIWDPASIFVKKLFAYLSGQVEEPEHDEPRTGSLIGKLERMIIAVLVIFEQLGGIGFVLTAKSIARFKQFEERGFAEKYLVGTLASTFIAMVVSLILRVYI